METSVLIMQEKKRQLENLNLKKLGLLKRVERLAYLEERFKEQINNLEEKILFLMKEVESKEQSVAHVIFIEILVVIISSGAILVPIGSIMCYLFLFFAVAIVTCSSFVFTRLHFKTEEFQENIYDYSNKIETLHWKIKQIQFMKNKIVCSEQIQLLEKQICTIQREISDMEKKDTSIESKQKCMTLSKHS